MFGCNAITTNVSGVPYLRTTGVAVGADAVDFPLGFRRVSPVGIMAVNIADAIPEGTAGTLPVRFTLNGSTRALTFFGGGPVTAADLAGTGVVVVFHNWYTGTLQLVSTLAPEA